MLNMIPRRYTEPKWQASITEPDKQFHFSNGTTVASLLELKQALVSLPDEVLSEYIGEEHHIANWVEFVIGHPTLASQLRKNHHRWGVIVALERGLMRTLNLPPHVARYWLRQVDRPFEFTDGTKIKSLADLKSVLNSISDEVVDFHLERDPNDIAIWVAGVLGDFELAEILTESSNRLQMSRFVEDHMQKLQEVVDSH